MFSPKFTLHDPDGSSQNLLAIDLDGYTPSKEFAFVLENRKEIYEDIEYFGLYEYLQVHELEAQDCVKIDTYLGKLTPHWKLDGANPSVLSVFPDGISLSSVTVISDEGEAQDEPPSFAYLFHLLQGVDEDHDMFRAMCREQARVLLLLCDLMVLVEESYFQSTLTVEDVELGIKHESLFVKVLTNRANFYDTGEPNWKKIEKEIKSKLGKFNRNLTYAMLDRIEGGAGIAEPIVSTLDQGKDFEREVAQLFSLLGVPVQFTPDTGDYGVDLLLTIGEKSVAVQVKKYSKPVGIQAVQEVASGMRHYRCNNSIVVSNVGYTDAAEQLAISTGVKLLNIDTLRYQLREFLVKAIL